MQSGPDPPPEAGGALTPALGPPGAQILPGEQMDWQLLLTSVASHALC